MIPYQPTLCHDCHDQSSCHDQPALVFLIQKVEMKLRGFEALG